MTDRWRAVRRRDVLTLCGTGLGLAVASPATGSTGAGRSRESTSETTVRLRTVGWTLPDDAVETTLIEVDEPTVTGAVADELDDVYDRDVSVVRREPVVLEVLADVDREAVASAASTALDESVAPEDLRESPSSQAVEETADVLERRLESFLAPEDGGGEATDAGSSDDSRGAVVDVETEDDVITVDADGDVVETVRGLATARRAQLVVQIPNGDRVGFGRLIWGDDVETTDEPVRDEETDRVALPVTLSDVSAELVASRLERLGFTDEGVDACGGNVEPETGEYCLLPIVDGEELSSFGLRPAVAEAIERGEFQQDGSVWLYTDRMEDAEQLRRSLVADSLPAPLEVASADVSGSRDGSEPAQSPSDGASEGDPNPGGESETDTDRNGEEGADVDRNGDGGATNTSGDDTDDSLPGPGVGGAAASAVLGSLLAKRRRSGDD